MATAATRGSAFVMRLVVIGFISLGGGLASPGEECYVITIWRATPLSGVRRRQAPALVLRARSMRMAMANACGCDHDLATWASQVEGACLRQGAQLTPLRRAARRLCDP